MRLFGVTARHALRLCACCRPRCRLLAFLYRPVVRYATSRYGTARACFQWLYHSSVYILCTRSVHASHARASFLCAHRLDMFLCAHPFFTLYYSLSRPWLGTDARVSVFRGPEATRPSPQLLHLEISRESLRPERYEPILWEKRRREGNFC